MLAQMIKVEYATVQHRQFAFQLSINPVSTICYGKFLVGIANPQPDGFTPKQSAKNLVISACGYYLSMLI
jgi:hypothetical protein